MNPQEVSLTNATLFELTNAALTCSGRNSTRRSNTGVFSTRLIDRALKGLRLLHLELYEGKLSGGSDELS